MRLLDRRKAKEYRVARRQVLDLKYLARVVPRQIGSCPNVAHTNGRCDAEVRSEVEAQRAPTLLLAAIAQHKDRNFATL